MINRRTLLQGNVSLAAKTAGFFSLNKQSFTKGISGVGTNPGGLDK